jgi:predicted MFS family arabinose efflux permease
MVMRIGRLKTIVLTSLLAFPVVLCLGIFPVLLLATILYPLFQIFWNMANGILQLFGMEVVPQKLRGQANSSYQVANQLALTAATPIGGLLISRLGYAPVFWIAAVFLLLSSLLLWWRFAGKRFVIPGASSGATASARATEGGQEEDGKVMTSLAAPDSQQHYALR